MSKEFSIQIIVVILIIVTLPVLILTGIRGFQASDRDTERIAHLSQIQSDLKLYHMRWGHYPGDKDGGLAAPSNWDDFAAAFLPLGINIPNDPVPTSTYYYAYDEDKTTYVLGARLERFNKALENVAEIDRISGIAGSSPLGMDCADNTLGYCVGSKDLSE